jgi:hypothetical protein
LDRRWFAIVAATVLLAGAAGYVVGTSRSRMYLLNGEAQTGTAQTSVRAPDGVYYAISSDVIVWVDSKGSLHDSGRPECLPQAGEKKAVTFGVVPWTLEGVTRRSVVWVSCRN